ncbi:MAG: hypothetical protein MPN21_16225, partial [Thermoanaerobaculia bacterium]|nr:hypothetical protein [Thermoanaerobaculia bacterium]
RDPALGRDYFERLRLLGEELAGGSGDLSEVVEDLGPSAELVDFGWLGADQLWGLGRNVEHAALSLRVGQISELVQEGPKLYLLELVALRTKRDLSDEESRETGRAALLAASRRRAGKDLRLQILAKRQVVEDPGS